MNKLEAIVKRIKKNWSEFWMLPTDVIALSMSFAVLVLVLAMIFVWIISGIYASAWHEVSSNYVSKDELVEEHNAPPMYSCLHETLVKRVSTVGSGWTYTEHVPMLSEDGKKVTCIGLPWSKR